MLDQSFLGNTILDWAIAVGATLLTGVVLIAVRMQGLRWLAVRNSKPHSRPIGWSLSVFEGTKPWFLIAVAMFVGLQFVAIPPKVDRFLEHVTIIAVIAQVAFWASLAIRQRGWFVAPAGRRRAGRAHLEWSRARIWRLNPGFALEAIHPGGLRQFRRQYQEIHGADRRQGAGRC